MRTDRRAPALALLLAWPVLATAEPAPAPSWASLPEALREHLQPLAPAWDRLPAAQREALLGNAEVWQGLPPDERDRRLQRLQDWLSLTPAQRTRLRQHYLLWQSLDAAARSAVERQQSALAAMDPQARQAQRAEFDRLPAAQRRALLPAPGAPDQALEALARLSFSFVPPGERGVTLEALARLDARERDDLRALSLRLAPWQREMLRRELLAVPAGQRGAWLRERLSQR